LQEWLLGVRINPYAEAPLTTDVERVTTPVDKVNSSSQSAQGGATEKDKG